MRTTVSCRPSATTASGSRWTRCAKSTQLEELWGVGKGPLEDWEVKSVDLGRLSWAAEGVFVAGHTGFKGGWLATWLARLGADVTGVARRRPTDSDAFFEADVAARS